MSLTQRNLYNFAIKNSCIKPVLGAYFSSFSCINAYHFFGFSCIRVRSLLIVIVIVDRRAQPRRPMWHCNE